MVNRDLCPIFGQQIEFDGIGRLLLLLTSFRPRLCKNNCCMSVKVQSRSVQPFGIPRAKYFHGYTVFFKNNN